MAELLRPGNAGSNTAADHIVVLDAALAQLPAALRTPDEHGRIPVLVRTDAAGATQTFATHLRSHGASFSLGRQPGPLRHPHRAAPALPECLDPGLSGPHTPRRRSRPTDRAPRGRVGGRAGRPGRLAPGNPADPAQGTPPSRRSAAPDRPRGHAPDRIPHRHPTHRAPPPASRSGTASPPPRPRRGPDPHRQDTGLRNLPFHDLSQNRVWVAIAALAADLLAFTARLALTGDAATYEPKRLRLRILAVATRIVHTARRCHHNATTHNINNTFYGIHRDHDEKIEVSLSCWPTLIRVIDC